ncbi:MAG: tetratricopeptide repeat protein [Bacteroides sp.]|nr:tetratricopeptide repeat protein [Bacteroides sp.]
MKKPFTIILLAISVISSTSATALTDKADEAYKNEDYSLAISLYEEAQQKDGTSSNLYFNLGNAYYRSGNMAKAILSYERALRLDPSNSNASANLEFVNERIVDKKGQTGSFVYNTYISTVNLMSSNRWATCAILFFILTCVALVIYLTTDRIALRKTGFFGGILTLLLSIVSIIFAFKARSLALDENDAIITSATSTLSTVPRQPMNHDEEAMLLHEGTKVRILRSIALSADSASQIWHEVEVDNKHRAWINDGDIEKIYIPN